MAEKKKFIIKRPGALTKLVGGAPSKNLGKVRKLANKAKGLAGKQARFFLNVLLPASRRRKKKSMMK